METVEEAADAPLSADSGRESVFADVLPPLPPGFSLPAEALEGLLLGIFEGELDPDRDVGLVVVVCGVEV